MRLLIVALSLLLSATSSDAAANDPYGEFEKPWRIFVPPEHVARWIGFVWTGAMTHPIMPAYFITETREPPQSSMTRYVKLSVAEYDVLSKFTHSHRCTAGRTTSKPIYPQSVAIQEFKAGKVRDLCKLSPELGCNYFLGVANLSGIDWSRKDTYPLYQFEVELGCKGSLTPFRRASSSPSP